MLQAQRLAGESSDPRPILATWIAAELAIVDLERGDFASARQITEQLAASGEMFVWMNALQTLASATLALGDEAASRAALARYLDGMGTAAVWPDTCWLLAALSISPDPELAALFIGAAARIELESGEVEPPGTGFEQPFRAKTAETLRRMLGDEALERLCQEGRDTPLHLLLERAGMPNPGAAGAEAF